MREQLLKERLTELAELRKVGRKVIGYSSHFVPVELIRSVGAIPVRLLRGGYDAETAGLSFLRPDACPHCLATLGNFSLSQAGFYGLVDAFASVNTCDLARRLPESVRVHFDLPTFELYLPRNSEPFPHRLSEFSRQLEQMGRDMASFCGTDFDQAALATAIRAEEALRAALRRLAGSGLAESQVLDLVTLATVLEPERFTLYASRFTPDSPSPFPPPQGGGNERERVTRSTAPTAKAGRPRLMLLGSELAEEDRWIVNAIEEQADIVADLLSEGRAWFADSCPDTGNPLADLASFYFFRQPAVFRRPNDYTYERIRELIRLNHVQGVILKTLLYCDPWKLEEVRLRKETGLPLLHIESNYAPENREQLRTRIEAFLESLGA